MMTVQSYIYHSLRRVLEKGFLAMIKTDDLGINGINPYQEYDVANPASSLTEEQIIQAQHEALKVTFFSHFE